MRVITFPAITILLTLTTFGAMAQELPCTDLNKFSPNQLLSSVEPTASTPWLSHGVGCYLDDASENKGCDWETTIKLDRAIGQDRRLIIATTTHLTGSGAWDQVAIFACRANTVRIALAEKFLYGVNIKAISDQNLVLEYGHWEPYDPTCCPSSSSYLTYNWDQETHKFKRAKAHKTRKNTQQ